MSGQTRQPRSIVTVNDVRLAFTSWETNSNGYYQADTFTVQFPLSQPGVKDPWLYDGSGWWSELTDVEIIIYDGYPKDPASYSISDLTLRIQGRADTIELDPIRKTVRVTGRDYTSKLTDLKVAPPDQNSTASDVALAYAEQFELEANVTKTEEKIGAYYQIDHVNLKVEKTAWDIICNLAHQEQFIVYVSGQTLNFIPPPPPDQAMRLAVDDSQLITTGPAPSINFSRSLTLSHGIVVYVRSWNQKQKKGFTVYARLKRSKDPVTKKNQPLTGEEQVYTYTFPNLTMDQAQQKANAYLSSISRHEVKFTADDMPGDPYLDPFQPVLWRFHGTQFEQIYYLESIVRSFDFENGYKMSLRGKNHSVESVVLL